MINYTIRSLEKIDGVVNGVQQVAGIEGILGARQRYHHNYHPEVSVYFRTIMSLGETPLLL